MAITLKAAGTWAEYTTDLQTVTIPGSPAAGDRMYLFVHWKDYAITLATPSGWTAIVNSFADGTVSTGNGLGSISQAVFYRDWQSGDANPTLDFSTTTGLLAEAVVMLWTKGGSDVWGSPSYVSAAWPSSSSQTVSSSTNANVPDGSVVMGSIGIRDDSATFTRGATTGIDVASGITWNGNYVESPATHYSTTTGNDHSGDLGHRFVTTGNASVALRVTATLSASETGSIVWVVQGLATTTTLTPDPVTIPISATSPTVALTYTLTPTPAVIPISATTPTLALVLTLTPTPATVPILATDPTVIVDRVLTPDATSIPILATAPSVALVLTLTPNAVAVVITPPAPTVVLTLTLTPTPAAVVLEATAPTIALGPYTVTPGPVEIPVSVPSPTVVLTLTLTPSAVEIPIAVPTPTIVVSGGGTTLTPDPVTIPVLATAPTIELGPYVLAPSPAVIVIAAAGPTVELRLDLVPPPVPVVIAVPDPTISVAGGVTNLSPSPVAVLIAVPSVNVIGASTRAVVVVSDARRTGLSVGDQGRGTIVSASRIAVVEVEDG